MPDLNANVLFGLCSFFIFILTILHRDCAKPNSLYFFAPADGMIMNYFVPVCPLLPSSAETAAVLRLPNLSVPACIMPYT